MHYTFTKELIDKYFIEGFGNYRGVKRYKVFSNSELVGQFFYFDDGGFFRYDENTVRLDKGRNVFKGSIDKFFDQQSGHQLATSNYKGWSNSLGTLTYKSDQYKFRKLTPDESASLFNIKSWGHYKMQLANGLTAITYRFQVKRKLFTVKQYNLHPFTGEIDTTGSPDMLLVLAGLYLTERMLTMDDVQ